MERGCRHGDVRMARSSADDLAALAAAVQGFLVGRTRRSGAVSSATVRASTTRTACSAMGDGRGDGSAAGELAFAPTDFRHSGPSWTEPPRPARRHARHAHGPWTDRLSGPRSSRSHTYVRPFYRGQRRTLIAVSSSSRRWCLAARSWWPGAVSGVRRWVERPKFQFQHGSRRYDRALPAPASKTDDRLSPESNSELRDLAIASSCDRISAEARPWCRSSSSRWTTRDARADATRSIATEEYGRRLLTDTARLLGPDHEDPAMRYSGSPARVRVVSSRQRRRSGHAVSPRVCRPLSAILRPGRRRARPVRSHQRLHGAQHERPRLPRNSPEMSAMVNYVESLGDSRFNGDGHEPAQSHRSAAFRRRRARPTSTPGIRSSTNAARSAMAPTAWACVPPPIRADGYVFPPLWGPDSFNDGAGMAPRAHRGPFHQGADAARRARR